jgi:hypothetical protein
MLTEFLSLLGLGPSKEQLQKNKEINKLGLSDAVEMTNMNTSGGNRRKASKRKREASKRNASKRKRNASRRK